MAEQGCLCFMLLRMATFPIDDEESCVDFCCFERVSMLPEDF